MIRKIISKVRSTKEVKDTIYLYILQIVDKIVPLMIIPYLMITLGAEKYGYIGFATAIVNYLLLIIEFGFNLSATKRVAVAKEQGRQELSDVFFSTILAKVLLLIVATVIILPIVLFSSSLRIYFNTILCTYPLVLGATLNINWLYQGIGKIKIAAIVTSFCKILVLPLVFIFVTTPADYNWAAFIQSSVYFLSSVVTIILLYRMHLIVRVKTTLQNVILSIKDSYPLFLSSVATSVYTQLFTLILGLMSTPIAVGRYTAAERFMRSVCFAIYSPVSMAFYPKISSLSYINRDNAKRLFSKLVVFMFILMLLLSLLLYIFTEPIVSLLGKDYLGIETLLRIVSFVPVAIALGAIYGQMGLIAMGNQKSKLEFRKVYFMAAPFSLLMVTFLAYLYSDIGAAVALLLTEYFVFFFMLRNYKKLSACY